MDVQMPDGTIISGVPDNITKSELLRRYSAYQKTQEEPEPTKDTGLLDMTGRAVMRGVKQLGSTFGDVIPAMAASAVGEDEYAKRQMEEAAATQKEIKEKYAPRYESYRDVKGLGDVLPYILETGAEQVPNIASVLLPGGVAGMGGRALAGRTATEALAARAAEKGMTEEAAANLAARVLPKAERTGQQFGQAAGVYLGSYALNSPEVFQNIYEKTGKLEPGAAALAGSVSAALDSVFPAYALNKLTPGVKAGVVERILERSGMKPGIARGAAADVITGVATEGPTEAAQEAISIAAEKFVDDHADVWNSQDFQRVVDAGVAGAAGSVLFGGVSGAARGYMQKKAGETPPAAEAPPPPSKNAYDEADQHDLDLEQEAVRQARGETAPPPPAPPSTVDRLAEEAFPSMETLQAQYDELEKERKSLLKVLEEGSLFIPEDDIQNRLQEIDAQQEQIAGEQDQLESRLQQRLDNPPRMPSAPLASMGPQQGLDFGEAVSQEQRLGAQPKDATKTFAPDQISEKDKVEFKSRYKLINMPIDDFLNLSEKGVSDEKLKGTTELLEKGTPYSSVPYLYVDSNGSVEGHEGRHRALALKEAGYTTMPVELRSANIRWDQQKDPAKFDYIEEGQWPAKLTAQKGAKNESFSVPFPVTREQAGKSYSELLAEREQGKAKAAPQQGLDLGAPVEKPQAPPTIKTVRPAEHLVTDVSAAPLERFLAAIKPSSSSELEIKKQRSALLEDKGLIRAIRDMYEDLKATDQELPYYTGLIDEFFNKYLKPLSPERLKEFENFDKLSAEEQKQFLASATNLPDLTTYDGVNKLKLAFNDFVSEQQLKGLGITPSTNAYAQAKQTLRKLKEKVKSGLKNLDKAERAANNYFRRFNFDTALRAAAFDMAYDTPRNELFSGQGADYAPFFQEWLLTNASPEVNRKFEQYRRAYEHLATRDAEIDRQREERSKYLEEEAATEEGYKEAERESRLGPFATSEKVSGSLTQMMHPAVVGAIERNDLNDALRILLAVQKKNLTPYQKQLITKLLSLNLQTSIGYNKLNESYERFVDPNSSIYHSVFDIYNQLEQLASSEPLINRYVRIFEGIGARLSATEKIVQLYDGLSSIIYEEHRYKEDYGDTLLPKNLFEEIKNLHKEVKHHEQTINLSWGVYFPDADSISLNTHNNIGANSVYVFLHEVMHAATSRVLNDPSAYGAKQQEAAFELKKLYAHSKAISKLDKYGFTNINEFVAEAFTNHEFQKVLQSIQYRNTSKSWWDKFVQFCMQMFGVDNVLGQTIIQTQAIFDAPHNRFGSGNPNAAMRGYYENNSNEQPGAIRNISNQIRNSKEFNDIKMILSELWSTMKDQTRKYFLGAFTLRQLEEMIGIEYNRLTGEFETKVPQISLLIKNIEDMQDSRNKTIQKGKPILDKLMKLYSSNKATSELLTRLIQTSTVEQLDPSVANPATPADKEKAALLKQLTADWEALGKMKDGAAAQELYIEMRDFFRDTLANYKRISAEREYRRIMGSKEAAERATREHVARQLFAYRQLYTGKTDEELKALIESEIEQDAQKLIASGKETIDTATARVLADKKIESQFEQMIDPYFPLKRFGRFWYKKGTGKDMKFYMFESAYARNEALKDARVKDPKGDFASGNDVRSMTTAALQNARLFEEIKEMIGEVSANTPEEQKAKLLDQASELFITTLPSQSIRNMFLHRKNVPGASADMVRSFAHAMFHLGYQQARFEYAPRMFDSMEAARNFLSTQGIATTPEEDVTRRTLNDYLNEVQRRLDNVLSPMDQASWVTFVSNLGFINFLTSPASAIVNMLAVPTIGYPVLAGPYGWGPARQAYSKYMKMLSGSGWKDELGNFDAPSIGRNKNLTEVEKRAYQAFIDSGLIDISMTHDVAGLSEQPSNDYTGRWHKVMTFAAFPFHKAERFNREVTAMAAFDLAYKSNGGNFEAAVEKAKNLTYKSMFDYSTANKPRYFQGDLPKVLLQFKQYAQHMTYLLFRTAYESTNLIGQKEYEQLMAEGKTDEANKVMKESIELRKDARRTFAGMMGMSFLFAGTMGMPVWFIFSGIANAFASVFGDDDDEYDVENWYKNWLNSVFGGFVGDSIARGVVPQITGASLSDRMSTNLTDMWWRDTKRNQDEVTNTQNAIINLLGPSAGMIINSAEAVKRFNDGHVERAFETIAPAAIKNIMAGSRLASEGALTMKGDTLLENISAKEAFLQMLGFSPERLAQRQAANIEAKSMEEALKSRRQDYLNFLAMAYDAGDSDAVAKILEKIADWNMVHPEKEFQISFDTIKASMKKRAVERAQASMLGGLRINKAFINRAEEMTAYADDDEE